MTGWMTLALVWTAATLPIGIFIGRFIKVGRGHEGR